MFMLSLPLLAVFGSLISSINARHAPFPHQHIKKADNDRFVFAHFMVGFVDAYTQADWTSDIALASTHGVDGFALNCDGQPQNTQQLTYAFNAASNSTTPFVLFISPDFVHFSYTDPGPVATFLKPWLGQAVYFKYEGKPFVSSFWGQGLDWDEVRKEVGLDLYLVPYYDVSSEAANDKGVNGLFSWKAWPGSMNEKMVDTNASISIDEQYISLLQPLQKTYLMPVSPWCKLSPYTRPAQQLTRIRVVYAHLPASTGYPKNTLLYSDTLWPDRWQQILQLATTYPDTVKFVEIITWNDWTESSLISSYKGTQTTDGNSKWSAGFDHSSMMDLMVPFIKAFKAGQQNVTVTEDMLVYWYRPSFKNASCDSTDSVGSKPVGWDMVADSIFVTALTTGPATVSVTSGTSISTQKVDSAGVHVLAFPMAVGSQEFSLTTDKGSGNGRGTILVSADCYNGEYNFNIATGTVRLSSNANGTIATVGNTDIVAADSGGASGSLSSSVSTTTVTESQVTASATSTPSMAATDVNSVSQSSCAEVVTVTIYA